MEKQVYYLKHENTKLAVITVDSNYQLTALRLTENKDNLRYLPYDMTTEEQVKKWLLNRGVPTTRERIGSDISPFGLMLISNGLSLTDHYWVHKYNENYDWKEINPYDNDFKASYTLDLQDDMQTVAGKTNFMPSSTLKGDLQKKWIIDKDDLRRLVKGNYGTGCRQSISEVLATKIHERQRRVEYTPYRLIEISTDSRIITGCECPNFVSSSTELLHAYDIVAGAKKTNDMSNYELYIQICEEHGVDNIRRFLEYQIMTDFIISNSDRHLNNFGIIRDSSSLEWLNPAPIFDSGNSMFYKTDIIPSGSDLLNLDVTSFLSKEVQLLKYVTDRGLVDIRKLPTDDEVYFLLTKDKTLDKSIRERLVAAYRQKIKYLEDFQNGADIWKYADL